MEGENALMNAITESSKCWKTSVTFEPQCSGLDYISQMPDDILVLILDKLPMEDAWRTCILAKRWKNIWRYKNIVIFDSNLGRATGSNVFKAAKNFLQGHWRKSIQCLSLSFRYNSFMGRTVNNWIESACKKNVEEMCIDLNGFEKKTKKRKHSDFLFLLDCEVECSTLVKLTLKFMELPILPTCITALKELYLEEVRLAANGVESITRNCPSLLLLSLCNCNVKSDLRIRISPKSTLFKLIINEMLGKVNRNTKLYVHAPSITMIEFASALPRESYHVEGTPVIDAVKFSLDQMRHSRRAVKVGFGGLLGSEFKANLIDLLRAYEKANMLSLSSWCIQVLGLQIMFRYGLDSSEATTVVLETGLRRVELIGLVYMLRACKGLKKLSIIITEPEKLEFLDGLYHTYFNGSRYPILDYEGNKSYTDVEDLPNLEVVEFQNYSSALGGDMCAHGRFFFDEARFFRGADCGLMALALIKEKAKNLRKIIFQTRKIRYEIDPHTYHLSSRVYTRRASASVLPMSGISSS